MNDRRVGKLKGHLYSTATIINSFVLIYLLLYKQIGVNTWPLIPTFCKAIMNIYKIFYTTSFEEGFRLMEQVVTRAVKKVNSSKKFQAQLQNAGDLPFTSGMGDVLKQIQEADLVISNVTAENGNFMYELGATQGLNKPTLVLLDNKSQIPFDIYSFRYLTYDSQLLIIEDKAFSASLSQKLADLIIEVFENPNNWKVQTLQKEINKPQRTVFVSYSHKDISYLERLNVHLRPLERKSLIQLWSDTLIQSGEKWKERIAKALDKSAIAILLISADFLASDFSINDELQPLLKIAEQTGTIIIPVILKACRFLREHSISQFKAINDPVNPLCKLNEWEQENIYERLSQRIEIALESEI